MLLRLAAYYKLKMKQIKYDPIYKNIQCFCGKKQTIQLGWEVLLYAYSFALVLSIALSVPSLWLAFTQPVGWYNFIFPGFTVLFLGLFWLDYGNCFKDMQKAGHTVACSKKVALKAMWRQSLYSDYQIDIEIIHAPPRQGHRAATVTLLLWIITIVTNIIFLQRYSYQDATWAIYPALFIFSIATATALLIKIEAKNRWLTVLCVLNIVSSGLMLLFYIFNILAGIL